MITQEILMVLAAVLTVSVLLVNIITEMVKDIYPLSEVATDLVVLVLSQVILNTSCYIYMDYASVPFSWSLAIIFIGLGFVVAYAAMKGWSTFIKRLEESRYPKREEE